MLPLLQIKTCSRCGTPNVEFDPYVPLDCRFGPLSGAYHLRLGDISNSLLEINVELYTGRLSAFTLVSFYQFGTWNEPDVVDEKQGVPYLNTKFEDSGHLDLNQSFQVAAQEDRILVNWQDLKRCTIISCGEIDMFVVNDELAGFRVSRVNESDMKTFRSHAVSTS